MHLIWFGTTPRLVVSSPELIREVLLSRSQHFDRYEAHPLIRQFEGLGLSNIHGEEWARRRKILKPAFQAENLRLLAPFVADTVQRMLEERVLRPGGSGEVEVDVAEWYRRLPQEVITVATFGRNNSDEGSAVFRLQAEHASYATEAHSKVFFPGYRFLPTRRNRRVWRLDREIRSLPGQARRRPAEWRRPAVPRKRRQHEGLHELHGPGHDVGRGPRGVQEPLLRLAGDTDQPPHLGLAMHPRWQDLARREVVDVCGRRGVPTKDHLPRLRTLGMVVNETLRLYPPVVAMIRKATRDVELGGCVVVPAGTEVMMPIMAVHHDTAVWGDDATEFNPARFADDGDRRPRQQMAFIPFGAGARVCIGQYLALMEAKIALALVLQRCDFRLSPAYVHAPRVLMILNPQHGAPVIFRPL